ncbi:MAG: heparinase II/III domain-containing protein [Armatimonadota bacterium]
MESFSLIKTAALCLVWLPFCVFLLVLMIGESQAAERQVTVPEDWPRCLPEHPRLILTPARLREIKEKLAQPEAREVLDLLKAEGERALALPPARRIVEGRRLLAVSREVERRVVLWAFLAVVLDDGRFADAAVKEMRNVAAFSDWNPSHFLDVAEMCAGIGLAYDWLYHRMSAEDRTGIRDGLLRLGLTPSLAEKGYWGTSNWNPVCNGGLTVGALAIAEDAPEVCRKVVERAINYVGKVEHSYAPDGVYAEGPTYWSYGTTFYVLLCDALLTAMGSTYQLEQLPGLLPSLQFLEHATGPTGKVNNYADCVAYRAPMPCYLWLAARSDTPKLGAREWQRVLATVRGRASAITSARYAPLDRLSPLFLIWGPPPAGQQAAALPLSWSGRGLTPLAAARTAWDGQAAYLSIKGGCATDSHAHMDAGTFVYEWGGVRWAVDLGMQDYHSIESRGISLWKTEQQSQRWAIFRIGPESHNILRFDDARQLVKGRTVIVQTLPGPPFATTVDLAPVYANVVTAAKRTASLFPDGRAVLEDRWTLRQPVKTIAWQMLTGASVQIEPGGCLLESGGKRLKLQVLEPQDARIECRQADDLLEEYDSPNPGITRIRVLVKGEPDREQVIRIALQLVADAGK